MEGQEQTIETGLETQVNSPVQSGTAEQGKVEGSEQTSSSGSSDNGQNGKGSWLTSAPKDIRESEEAKKYPSLWEYVRHLRNAAEGKAEPATTGNDTFADDWKNYLGGITGNDPVIEALNKALQDEKIPASAAKKASEAIVEASRKNIESVQNSARTAQEERARAFIQKNWGSTKEEKERNLNLYQRCATLMKKEKPEEFEFLEKNRLLSEPAVVTLIMGLYSQRQEIVPPGGFPGGQSYNVNDPYGIA